MYLNTHLRPLMSCLAAAAVLCGLALPLAVAQGVKKKIQFARGASSATVQGAVIRGEQDRYYLGAKQGQTMSVKITAEEDNAVFQVYLPGEQETLSGAGEGDDARNWSGELPRDGDYVIVVGGTRGNASYKLTVSIE